MSCCEEMEQRLSYRCSAHPSPFDCADNLVYKFQNGKIGIIIHDGGSAISVINFCPWCGSNIEVTEDENT